MCSESSLRRLLFLVKMLLSGQYPQQRGSLPIQKTVHKTTILMWRTVAQRISTWKSVEEEHSFNTEGGGREGGFNMIGGGGEGGFNMIGGSAEDKPDTQ